MGVSRLLTGALAGLFVLGAPVASAAQERPAPPHEARGERAGGWLGLGLDHEVRCPREDERTGVESCDHALLIETVVVGSPADEAGVLPGDTVIASNGRGLFTEEGELDIPSFEAGDEVRLLLGREGGRVTLTVIAGERPARAGMVPMKVHRRAHHPETPAAPNVAVDAPRILVAPMPSGSDAAARAGTVRARARVIHDSVLAAAREQLDSVRKIRWEQMEELRERLREVREARSEVEREELEEAAERVERRLEERAEEMRRLDSAFRTWDPPTPPEAGAYRSVAGAGIASRVHRLGGAELLALHPELARSFPGVERGLLVLRTVEGTPAAGVGLRPGDVIVEASGLPIARASDLQRALVGHAERDSTVVTWVRGGERMQGVMRDR